MAQKSPDRWTSSNEKAVNVKFLEVIEFNFDQWISDHGLNDMRYMFIKHEMTTVELLSPCSAAFREFISDPQLFRNHSQLIPKAVSAIQKVSDSYVVISEEENNVIKRMKKIKQQLEQTGIKLSELKKQHPLSIQQIKVNKEKRISETQHKIDQDFEAMNKAFQRQKNEFKYALQHIKSQRNKPSIIDYDSKQMHDDDCKVSEKTIQLSANHGANDILLQRANDVLSTNFTKFKYKIETETISDRKNSILRINKETIDKCSKIQNKLSENMKQIQIMIDKNKAIFIHIDFVTNDKVYNKILSKINKIGFIVNEEYDSSEHKANQDRVITHKDEDDEMINKLEQEVKQKNETIQRLMSEIHGKHTEIHKLQEDKESSDRERTSISAQLQKEKRCKEHIMSKLTFDDNNHANDYRWIHKIDDDEKEYEISLCRMFADNQKLIDCHGSIETDSLRTHILKAPADDNDIVQCVGILKQNAIRFLKQFKIEMLPFSNKYRSHGGYFEFSDDIYTIKRTRLVGCAYVLCDADPVTTGVHCWRVKITNPLHYSCWVMFGVSKKRAFQDMSWKDGVYGVSCCYAQYFPSNVDSNNADTSHLHNAKYVDILLDVDNGEMGICEVGYRKSCLGNRKEARLWNLPVVRSDSGWVPHFNIGKPEIELRVCKIPISFYGKQKPNIF